MYQNFSKDEKLSMKSVPFEEMAGNFSNLIFSSILKIFDQNFRFIMLEVKRTSQLSSEGALESCHSKLFNDQHYSSRDSQRSLLKNHSLGLREFRLLMSGDTVTVILLSVLYFLP